MKSANLKMHGAQLFVGIVVLTMLGASQALAAGPESTLLKFAYSANGFNPFGNLVSDGTNFYGTTTLNLPIYGGVVYELSPPAGGTGPWTETVLYTFTGGSDGYEPYAGLVRDAKGNLYGTTAFGGYTDSGNCDAGCGTVFELSPGTGGTWTETTLYQFHGGSDGAHPEVTLVLDQAGNLYGTTPNGNDILVCCGTAFELSPPASGSGFWTETILHSFGNGTDGNEPEGGLYRDEAGNLFGTTDFGGTDDDGTVYKLIPPTSGGSWTEQIVYSFTGGTDGAFPTAGVVAFRGALYGTTGYGSVFQITFNNGVASLNVLHDFQGTDGNSPNGLIVDSSGNLYGTTYEGGNPACHYMATNGCGVIFELSPPQNGGSWTETTLYEFNGHTGFGPLCTLMLQHKSLWGTTQQGGDNSSSCKYGCGVVFRLQL